MSGDWDRIVLEAPALDVVSDYNGSNSAVLYEVVS